MRLEARGRALIFRQEGQAVFDHVIMKIRPLGYFKGFDGSKLKKTQRYATIREQSPYVWPTLHLRDALVGRFADGRSFLAFS